jgi:UDP-N-acetylglucosamine acyltransferase
VIHPTAVVDPTAVLGSGVRIGPYSVIGAGVRLGDDCELVSHAVLLGPATLGARNVIHPFATLGSPPQDRSWQGEPTRLEGGDDNVFREQVSVHRGTSKGGGLTRIGSRCLLMAGAHVAHDCRLGDDVVLTNLTTLGGHVEVADRVVCGGQVAVAPFVRLGRAAFLAGGARVERDVPPFLIAAGDRARARAVNRVGLERLGVPEASRRALKRAFSILYRSGAPLAEAIQVAEREVGRDAYVRELLAFLSY